MQCCGRRMQKIFYRAVPWAFSGFNKLNQATVEPSKAAMETVCAEFEGWANANGFKITSVATAVGGFVNGLTASATSSSYTCGLVFVCDYVGGGDPTRVAHAHTHG